MTQTPETLTAAVAGFALLYAALTGWRFALRLRSERAGRRKGVALNALRRGLPAVLAGALILGAGVVLARPGAGWLAALVIGGGLAYALHRGLAEMRQDTHMLILLRLGASLGLTFAFLWIGGLV